MLVVTWHHLVVFCSPIYTKKISFCRAHVMYKNHCNLYEMVQHHVYLLLVASAHSQWVMLVSIYVHQCLEDYCAHVQSTLVLCTNRAKNQQSCADSKQLLTSRAHSLLRQYPTRRRGRLLEQYWKVCCRGVIFFIRCECTPLTMAHFWQQSRDSDFMGIK